MSLATIARTRRRRLFADADDIDDRAQHRVDAGRRGRRRSPPARKPARPIEIVHLAAGMRRRRSSRADVIASAPVRAGAVRRQLSRPDGVAYQVNAVTELDVGARRQGRRSRGCRRRATAATASRQPRARASERDATLDHLIVTAGAALSRWQGFVDDRRATARRSASMAPTCCRGKEHGDLTLGRSPMREPASASRELFKNVVDGEAEGAFQGKIVVEPGAQKTDAKMMTQALLLSDAAEFAVQARARDLRRRRAVRPRRDLRPDRRDACSSTSWRAASRAPRPSGC